jgi:hypothetical protein
LFACSIIALRLVNGEKIPAADEQLFPKRGMIDTGGK